MKWLTDLFRPKGPNHVMDGETVEQAQRRLGLAYNQNPPPNPNWRLPLPPKAPPPPPSQGGICLLEQSTRLLEQNQALRREVEDLNRELKRVKKHESILARRITCLQEKWPTIHRSFFTVAGEALTKSEGK